MLSLVIVSGGSVWFRQEQVLFRQGKVWSMTNLAIGRQIRHITTVGLNNETNVLWITAWYTAGLIKSLKTPQRGFWESDETLKTHKNTSFLCSGWLELLERRHCVLKYLLPYKVLFIFVCLEDLQWQEPYRLMSIYWHYYRWVVSYTN